MLTRIKPQKVVPLLVVLIVNLSLVDVYPANDIAADGPDSTAVQPDTTRVVVAADDTTSSEQAVESPVYRKWWFWVAVGSLCIITAILLSGEETPSKTLPDFPEPPEH